MAFDGLLPAFDHLTLQLSPNMVILYITSLNIIWEVTEIGKFPGIVVIKNVTFF